ncbi:MAG: hypothetical protein JO108_19850 [Acidobacteriaceae bacterium]|nr:hypothetical protein [Acidobacteriaceae bacterium]
MSTRAQITANKANSQKSTGPRTDQGKSHSSRNNFRHGFTGAFCVFADESQSDFDRLLESLCAEHSPSTPTESLLVESLAQHYWLKQRAIRLHGACGESNENQLALYLRYQVANDRAFHKCLDQLAKLRAEKRKAEIGFESQRRAKAKEARLKTHENRRAERHGWALLLDEAKVDGQRLLNLKLNSPNYPGPPSVRRVLANEPAA